LYTKGNNKMKNKIGMLALVASMVSFTINASTEIKFGMQAAAGSLEYQSAEVFSKKLSELSQGDLSVSLFPSAVLGDDRAMLQQLTMGDLGLTFASMGRVGLWIPRASAMDLPYVVKDHQHAQRIFSSSFGQSIREKMEKDHGWYALNTWYNGTRETTSNRALNTIDDFAGLKLRVPNAKTLLGFARLVGASPTPMSFSEVYLALQTNAVDGQENPLHTINTMKFYEVQSNLAMTNHLVDDTMLIVSSKVWSSLSVEQKKMVQIAADYAESFHTKSVQDKESKLISYFEGKGVEVTYPDMKVLRKAMSPMYAEFNADLGKDVISEILKI